jgi:ADP-heptose:LPS heptosyltransferase
MKAAMVFLRGALGDCLLAWPVLAALPGRLEVEGLALIGPAGPLSLFRNQPMIQAVWDQDRAAFSALYADPPRPPAALSEWIPGGCAVVFTSRPDADPLIANLKRLGCRVHPAPVRPPAGGAVHITDHMARELGVAPPAEAPILTADAAEAAEARDASAGLGLAPGAYWVVQPGSGGSGKNWHISGWLDVAERLVGQGSPVCFLLGPAEEEMAADIDRRAGPGIYRLTGLALTTAAAFIKEAKGYLGLDSGISHLAAWTGAPTLAVFGPTDPRCWAPRGPGTHVLAPPNPTADWSWLTPEAVVTAGLDMVR